MKVLRIVIAIVVLCVAAPLIAVNVWGVQMTFWAIEQTRQNDAYLADGTPPSPTALPANPLQFLRNRGELQDTFGTATLTDRRIVQVTTIIAAEDMLAPGEVLPEPTRLPLYAAARAPARMIRYCQEVVTTFATACDVVRTSTDVLDDGRIEITADLTYIPAAYLGDPAQISNGAFFTTVARFYDMPDADKPVFDAEARLAAMQQAQDLCDTLRESFGPCVVGRLQLATAELWITDLERLPAGTARQRLSATAVVKVYANQDETTDDALRDMVAALVNAD